MTLSFSPLFTVILADVFFKGKVWNLKRWGENALDFRIIFPLTHYNHPNKEHAPDLHTLYEGPLYPNHHDNPCRVDTRAVEAIGLLEAAHSYVVPQAKVATPLTWLFLQHELLNQNKKCEACKDYSIFSFLFNKPTQWKELSCTFPHWDVEEGERSLGSEDQNAAVLHKAGKARHTRSEPCIPLLWLKSHAKEEAEKEAAQSMIVEWWWWWSRRHLFAAPLFGSQFTAWWELHHGWTGSGGYREFFFPSESN